MDQDVFGVGDTVAVGDDLRRLAVVGLGLDADGPQPGRPRPCLRRVWLLWFYSLHPSAHVLTTSILLLTPLYISRLCKNWTNKKYCSMHYIA
jgi:hypothetical protein